MADKTKIEWTDATWNPIRGCTRVSEGCRNCYAEGVAKRFNQPGQAYEGLVRIGGDGKPQGWSGEIAFVERHLLDPLRWKRPRKIFVNSMSDLFHENVTDEMRDRIFAVMALCPQHTFQVLTKRPDRMRAYLAERTESIARDLWNSEIARAMANTSAMKGDPLPGNAPYELCSDVGGWPLKNVWLGVSVENQKTADERIPLLLQTPASVRFLSCEPLLGLLDLDAFMVEDMLRCREGFAQGRSLERGYCGHCFGHITDPVHTRTHLDWVIAGGESGRNARPMHPDWARSLRDQCVAAGVPFFFKQWGEWLPWESEHEPCWASQNGRSEDSHALFPENIADNPTGWDCGLGFEDEGQATFQRVGKKLAGSLLDGVQHHAFPEVR